RARANAIAQAGGAAAILLSNGAANIDAAFDATAAVSSRGTYAIDSAGGPAGGRPPPPPSRPHSPSGHDPAPTEARRPSGGRTRPRKRSRNPDDLASPRYARDRQDRECAFERECVQRDVLLPVGERHRSGAGDGSSAGERVRPVQRAPGS